MIADLTGQAGPQTEMAELHQRLIGAVSLGDVPRDFAGLRQSPFQLEYLATTLKLCPHGSLTCEIGGDSGYGAIWLSLRGIAAVSPAAARTSSVFDAASQQIATQDALGYLHSTVFDALGRVQASVNPLAARWTSLYDNASQGIAQVDPLANRVSVVFDPLGRTIATQDGRGYLTSFVLDAAGQQLALVDANSGRWSGLFDVRGLQYATQDPLGAFATLQFDPNANVHYRTDARGRVTSFTADALNRTAGQLYPDSTRVTNTWDQAGRQVTMQDLTGITSFGWDAADRQISVIQPLINRPLSYTLDALGQRLVMIDIESQRFSYSWDPAARLVQIVNPYAEITTLQWDALDREQRRILANSVSVSHTYDPAGNETVLENRKSDGAALSVYSATYDQVGNRLSVAEFDGARVSYLHDASYQLYNENRSGANAFNYTLSYDPVGNRLTKVEGAQRTTQQFNAANELTLTLPPSGQPTTSSWDANGNLRVENTGGALTTRSWDDENRLTRIDNSDGTNEQYTYSADGMREKKVAAGSTILFVRDNQNVLIETDGGLVVQATYIDLPGIWGGKFSLRRSGASRFYLPDQQGHSRHLVDGTSSITDTFLADAWGIELLNPTATISPYKAFGQWGYYRDAAKRLYVGWRNLQVTTGRWLSRDPAGLWAADANLYGYARSNPVSRIDPTGAQSSCGRARTRECEPTPRFIPCCVPAIVAESAQASFSLTLPRDPPANPIYGPLRVTVNYLITYLPISPLADCPGPERQRKSVSSSALSGATSHHRRGHFWHENLDPLPPNSATREGYMIDTTCREASEAPAMVLGSEAFRFFLNGEAGEVHSNVPRSDDMRALLRIHPDGGSTGTGGCIGLQSELGAQRIRSCLQYIHDYGLAAIALTVSRD